MKHLIHILLMIALCLGMGCQEVVELSTDAEEVIYVRRDGADMAAHIRGNTASKAFVIIVHGGPGGNGLEYRNGVFKEQLERHFAFVYWDQRGQGGSHGNFGEEQLTIANMVDDLEALIRAWIPAMGKKLPPLFWDIVGAGCWVRPLWWKGITSLWSMDGLKYPVPTTFPY